MLEHDCSLYPESSMVLQNFVGKCSVACTKTTRKRANIANCGGSNLLLLCRSQTCVQEIADPPNIQCLPTQLFAEIFIFPLQFAVILHIVFHLAAVFGFRKP